MTHLRSAKRLRGAELGVTAVAAVLSAITAAIEINLAVWIGAATTIGAAFTAHLAATRHDRIAVSYAATVDQLDHLVDRLPPEPDATTAARFVDSVERILIA